VTWRPFSSTMSYTTRQR